MATKLTRSKVLAERLCGLKYWDKAVILTTREEIINKTIQESKNYPKVHSYKSRWDNVDWAFGNTIRRLVCPNKSVRMTFNLNDVLTDEEINFIAQELQILESFQPTWPRKP